MNTWYYYIRDENRKPRVTICIKKTIDGKFVRGLSIFSGIKNPYKDLGRTVSNYRAIKAIETKKTEKPYSIDSINEFDYLVDENIKYRMAYDVTLTEYEKKFVGSNQ